MRRMVVAPLHIVCHRNGRVPHARCTMKHMTDWMWFFIAGMLAGVAVANIARMTVETAAIIKHLRARRTSQR